jgi:hypothetical protein
MRVNRKDGFTFDELADIVRSVSDERYGGNVRIDTAVEERGKVIRFKLRAEQSGDGKRGGDCAPGARRSWSGTRTVSACWHAHRDILRALFQAHPQAVIVTAMARYEGLAGFEDTYPDTAHKNIGSMMEPAYMPALCDCSEGPYSGEPLGFLESVSGGSPMREYVSS